MRVALDGCLSVLNVFLRILHQAFCVAISGKIVSPDIHAEISKSLCTVIVKLFS
jgi:hypothetical protein